MFDWELAAIGDWRFDLATLAVSAYVTDGIEGAARDAAFEAMAAACGGELIGLFAACLAVRHLGFTKAAQPGHLEEKLAAIDAHVAPWWRS